MSAWFGTMLVATCATVAGYVTTMLLGFDCPNPMVVFLEFLAGVFLVALILWPKDWVSGTASYWWHVARYAAGILPLSLAAGLLLLLAHVNSQARDQDIRHLTCWRWWTVFLVVTALVAAIGEYRVRRDARVRAG